MTQYAVPRNGRIYAYYKCARLLRFGKDGCSPDRVRTNHRAEEVERSVWELVSELMQDPKQLVEGLESMIELESHSAHGDPEREAKAWLDKLAEVDSERRGYLKLAARGTITDLELDEALVELEETRATAERELATLRTRQEAIEALERDREVLLEHYAAIAPEALDSLTPEERHRLYKMLRLTEQDGHNLRGLERDGALALGLEQDTQGYHREYIDPDDAGAKSAVDKNAVDEGVYVVEAVPKDGEVSENWNGERSVHGHITAIN